MPNDSNGSGDAPAAPPVDYSWAPPLVEHPLGEGRRLRVVGIGAGFSGINLALHLRENVRDVDVTIYDLASDVGGVWHHNRYMGVACDIPSHAYQYSFAENTQWSRFFAPGEEIRQYLVNIVDKYNLRPLMKLQHEVIEARWDAKAGHWALKVKDLLSGIVIDDTADYVAYATGLLSHPKWPDIPGRETYKGILHHSSGWDAVAEEAEGSPYAGKRVGVIGVGASAIQIVPEMQKRAAKVVNFGRAQTWLSGVFAAETLKKVGVDSNGANHTFTDAEKTRLKDAEYYREFRAEVERDLASVHLVTHQGQPLQEIVREALLENMTACLAGRPEVAKALIPDFPPGCKRLTPGPGYMDALVADNVEFVSSGIEAFTERGIRTTDGQEHELDAIICATGFDTSFKPGFPIYGLDGLNLQDMWQEDVVTYLAITVPRMPNFFTVLGPNSGVGSGSLLILMEQQVAYVSQAINKAQREGYRSMVVRDGPAKAFTRYTDDYFGRTVFSANCKSWYKNGAFGAARIRSLWPGSSSHAFLALKHPRWEDYQWERDPEYIDDMAWLGNGDVPADLDPAFYVNEARDYYKEQTMYIN